MKYLLEMNHFLPILDTGNAKKSNVQLDTYEIPEKIKKFFSSNSRNLSMISEIHEDGSIDVNGNIVIYMYDLINKKLPFRFGYVSGDFDCSYIELTSLEGCPQKVGGYFDCGYDQLKSLEGCPQEVGGYFSCANNQLTSLEGCPQEVGKDFNCENNELISLEGCPQEVGGYFSCECNQLTSLEGCPKEVGGSFNCENNQLMSLECCPKEVRGNFYCGKNPGNFTEDYIRQLCNVKGEIKI